MAHRLVDGAAVSPMHIRVAVALAATATGFGVWTPSGASALGGIVAQAESPSSTCETRDILLLVDQSASLQTNDPNNQRVDGAEALVDGLSNAGVDATLSIAGFGSIVTPIRSFNLPAQRSEANAAIEVFRGLPTDDNTDYILAMLKAVQYFQASAVPSECKTLMWFTDGAFDIEDTSPSFVGEYTILTDPKQIIDNFAGAVCGPVPPGFILEKPLAEQIAFEFVVRLIDLRGNPTGSAAEKRARTDEVLNRMLTDGPDGACGVDGRRIDVSEADDIVRAFFDEAQAQAGRRPVDCAALQSGIAAGVVESVAVLARPAGASVELRIGEDLVSAEQSTQYTLTATDRQRAAKLTASATNGELESCFVDVSARIEASGEPQLYEDAASTPVYVAVGNLGVSSSPLSGVGDDTVVLSATVDGVSQPIAWDPVTTQWVANLPTPSGTETRLDVSGEFTGVLAGMGQIDPLSIVIPVRDVPSVPQARWSGATYLEGIGTLDGTIEISMTADTDATICFDLAGLPADLVGVRDGAILGRFEAEDSQICGPASEALEIPARLVIEQSSNATGTASVPFTATFEPVGEQPKPMGDGSVLIPEIDLAKPVDSSTQIRLAALLAAASAILTYLLMLGFTAMQAKLRDPREMLLVTTRLREEPGTNRLRRENGNAPIRLSDLKQVLGSRTRYELSSGLVLRRRLSFNPFGRLSAVVQSERQMLAAHPASGPAVRKSRRVPVPLRFGSLVIVAIDPTTSDSLAMAIVPIGTSPAATATIVDEGLRRLDGQISRMISTPTGQLSDRSTPEVPDGPPSSPRAAADLPTSPGPRNSPPITGGRVGDAEPPKSARKPPPPPHRR